MILTLPSNQSHPVLAREENLIRGTSSESYPATDTEKINKPEIISLNQELRKNTVSTNVKVPHQNILYIISTPYNTFVHGNRTNQGTKEVQTKKHLIYMISHIRKLTNLH